MQDFDAIPETALAWHRDGQVVAIATVIETWGSAPRPVGSQMAVSGQGVFSGSVSGGCVEGDVVLQAQEALQDGSPRVLDYGVSDDTAFAVGLACGGRIRVLVEPVGAALAPDLLQDLVDRRARREAVAYAVVPGTAGGRLAGPDDAQLGPAIAERLRSDKSGFEGEVFVGLHNPPLRLAIVGAVHIAQPLARMARLAGYDVTIIDPRQAFASEGRFPDERLIDAWPDEGLAAHGLDARTAVVTLTHDPKLDDPAITTALGSGVFYLGCLGSTRTHAKRLDRLHAAGVDEADLSRIHAPVGLDIGAKSPAEIAVSILAEMTLRLRRGDGAQLPP